MYETHFASNPFNVFHSLKSNIHFSFVVLNFVLLLHSLTMLFSTHIPYFFHNFLLLLRLLFSQFSVFFLAIPIKNETLEITYTYIYLFIHLFVVILRCVILFLCFLQCFTKHFRLPSVRPFVSNIDLI